MEPQPAAPVAEPKKFALTPLQLVAGAVGILVIGAVGAFAYLELSDRGDAMPTPVPTLEPTLPTEPTTTPVTGEPYEELVQVSWYGRPELASPPCPPDQYCEVITYRVGQVISGPHTGGTVFLDEEQSIGNFYSHHTMSESGEKIPLTNIHGVHDIPEFLSFAPKPSYQLKKSYGVGSTFDRLQQLRLVFTDPVVGAVYVSDEWDCFFIRLPDGTAQGYDLHIPFINIENGDLAATIAGVDTRESYEYMQIRGCGALCTTPNVKDMAELRPGERLEAIGTTSTGETLWRIRDVNDQALVDLYNDKSTVAYYTDSYEQLSTNRYTYEQFISFHPYLYWHDPMGRWIEFRNKRFIVAAEMCKPVIYLYPTAPTDLTVHVHPTGGFTYTEPKYGDGWEVRAYPDGTIVDRRTGLEHEYLFWEGIGLNYPTSKEGWVVAREDVGTFIDEKLSYLGLQGRELRDFRAYWVDRLTEKPYYKLSFLTPEQFNLIAPLEISQSPDTALRILMTAEGLDERRTIAPQELEPAAARGGFTLIEWGGVVLR